MSTSHNPLLLTIAKLADADGHVNNQLDKAIVDEARDKAIALIEADESGTMVVNQPSSINEKTSELKYYPILLASMYLPTNSSSQDGHATAAMFAIIEKLINHHKINLTVIMDSSGRSFGLRDMDYQPTLQQLLRQHEDYDTDRFHKAYGTINSDMQTGYRHVKRHYLAAHAGDQKVDLSLIRSQLQSPFSKATSPTPLQKLTLAVLQAVTGEGDYNAILAEINRLYLTPLRDQYQDLESVYEVLAKFTDTSRNTSIDSKSLVANTNTVVDQSLKYVKGNVFAVIQQLHRLAVLLPESPTIKISVSTDAKTYFTSRSITSTATQDHVAADTALATLILLANGPQQLSNVERAVLHAAIADVFKRTTSPLRSLRKADAYRRMAKNHGVNAPLAIALEKLFVKNNPYQARAALLPFNAESQDNQIELWLLQSHLDYQSYLVARSRALTKPATVSTKDDKTLSALIPTEDKLVSCLKDSAVKAYEKAMNMLWYQLKNNDETFRYSNNEYNLACRLVNFGNHYSYVPDIKPEKDFEELWGTAENRIVEIERYRSIMALVDTASLAYSNICAQQNVSFKEKINNIKIQMTVCGAIQSDINNLQEKADYEEIIAKVTNLNRDFSRLAIYYDRREKILLLEQRYQENFFTQQRIQNPIRYAGVLKEYAEIVKEAHALGNPSDLNLIEKSLTQLAFWDNVIPENPEDVNKKASPNRILLDETIATAKKYAALYDKDAETKLNPLAEKGDAEAILGLTRIYRDQVANKRIQKPRNRLLLNEARLALIEMKLQQKDNKELKRDEKGGLEQQNEFDSAKRHLDETRNQNPVADFYYHLYRAFNAATADATVKSAINPTHLIFAALLNAKQLGLSKTCISSFETPIRASFTSAGMRTNPQIVPLLTAGYFSKHVLPAMQNNIKADAKNALGSAYASAQAEVKAAVDAKAAENERLRKQAEEQKKREANEQVERERKRKTDAESAEQAKRAAEEKAKADAVAAKEKVDKEKRDKENAEAERLARWNAPNKRSAATYSVLNESGRQKTKEHSKNDGAGREEGVIDDATATHGL